MANVIKTIQDAVLDQIQKLGPRVESSVVDMMVDKELQKRTPAIVQGLEKLVELEKEYEKTAKPDLVSREIDGTVLSQAYSSKKIEEIKKAKEKVEKLSKAIEKAFEHGDLKDLNQLLQQSGKPDQQSGKDKKEGGAEATGEAS